MDIVLIESDDERRAQIGAMIECIGGASRSYAWPAEFGARARWAPFYLVADTANALLSMTILLSRFERPAYIVAYRSTPAIQDVVGALTSGATDYLAWPFTAQAIRSRMQTATAREANRMGIVDSSTETRRGPWLRGLIAPVAARLRRLA